MIIVKLQGGLGNQMFQYAAGRRLAELHRVPLKLDLGFLLDRTPRADFVFRDFALDIFPIDGEILTPDDRRGIDLCNSPLARLLGKFKTTRRPFSIIREPHFHFHRQLLEAPDNAYLDGYWQSEKYFQDIEAVIRKDFSFKSAPGPQSQAYAGKISAVNSVCLNVRRGDFVSNPTANKLHGFLGLDYIKKCLRILSERVANPCFFVFSDDVQWCRENIRMEYPCTVIPHDLAGEHLYLMTLCRHYIIPNSTFAWWAAWLNTNPEKLVLAPEKWFNDPEYDTRDLLPSSWLKVS